MMMKWKKRTLFLVVTAVVISAAVAACVFLIPPIRKKLEKREKPTTTTIGKPPALSRRNGKFCDDDCTMLGGNIIGLMNKEAVDPCKDFYKYSCGEFSTKESRPHSWPLFTWHDKNSIQLDRTVSNILRYENTVNLTDSLSKAKMVYRTCNRITDIPIDKYSIKTVLSNTGTGIGEWPFLKPEWNDCRLDLEWRMAKLNAMGLDSLFQLDVQFGKKEPNKLQAVLRLAEPLVKDICKEPLPYNISLVLEERTLEHRQILTSVLNKLDVNMNNVTEQDIDDLFEFDFLFCNATKESRLKRPFKDVPFLNMSLRNFADISTQINWLRWKHYIFSELDLEFKHNELNIFVEGVESSAVDGINRLLQQASSKVLANYLTWRFVLNHLGFLGSDILFIQRTHARLLTGRLHPTQNEDGRWIQERDRQCAKLVKELMPFALVRPYSNTVEMASKENEMQSLISIIVDEFKRIMLNTKQMKQPEKNKSNHMIDIVREHSLLAYPYKREAFFNNFYEDSGITEDSLLRNVIGLRYRRMKYLLEGVSREKSVLDMEYAIQMIYSFTDAEIYSHGNQIAIGLGVLEEIPKEGKLYPKFTTLSRFGWKYGRELVHVFDLRSLDGSTGRNWTQWYPETIDKVKERAECFRKQYPSMHNMTIEEALETTTLNEDIVDHQALTLAHRAYLTYLNGSDNDPTPSSRLTNKQLFFVSYVQQFCELLKEDEKIPIHPHRQVNNILRKYAPFYTTFKCGREDPVNQPVCLSLWE